MKLKSCQHLDDLQTITEADERVCRECQKSGDTWIHLRCCQTCGAVLCCDSSPNKHASKHAAEAGHPVIISAEPGERWAWCYVDELIKRY